MSWVSRFAGSCILVNISYLMSRDVNSRSSGFLLFVRLTCAQGIAFFSGIWSCNLSRAERCLQSANSSALQCLTSPRVEHDGVHCGSFLVTEVCTSYSLIFQNDRRSRKHFYRVEKPKLERDGAVLDPLLVEICCHKPPAILAHHLELFPPVDSFKHDFSALARRLRILQNFAETALPKRRRSLGNDRRNLEKSYTFKAVVVFGSLGVVIGLIQIVLSGMQVAYAIKPVFKS